MSVCAKCGVPRSNVSGSVLKLCRACWLAQVKKPPQRDICVVTVAHDSPLAVLARSTDPEIPS